jgi:predicted dehydrogenase
MRAKKQIAQWLSDGSVGKMRYVRVTIPPGDWVGPGFAHLIDMGEKVPPMQADPKPEGMDPEAFKYYVYLVNYYVHQVNLLRHLLGGDYEIKFADPNGRTFAGVGKGDLSKVTVVVEMAPYDTTIAWQETALVCFDKGWVKVELPRPLASDEAGRVSYYTDPGKGAEPTLTEPEMPKRHAMQQQAINFIAAIKGETTPLCSAAEAQKDLDTLWEYQTLFAAAGGLIKSPWG